VNFVDKVTVRFSDVAGLENPKKEISEFVEFMKNKKKFSDLGARIPRGVLLEGPPGTGKTLLAKAVAGEAGVAFFATAGSDFIEMFAGMGSSRIRKLFEQAKQKAPAIIFIDEIDSIGKARSNSSFDGGERDETLNQLLVQMDGFGTDENVIVICATNRKDLLDKALTRSGRLDRVIRCDIPDRKEREEIVKIYLKKVALDEGLQLGDYAAKISAKTTGFTGADLSNLVNEAAIVSAREDKLTVDLDSIEKAFDRKISGLKITQPLNSKERKLLAYFHASKVIVSWFNEHASPFLKVSIIPKQKVSGFEHAAEDDLKLHSKEQVLAVITLNLAGRVAEEMFCNTCTDHSASNLIKATKIAYRMLTNWGMGEKSIQSFTYGEESIGISENTLKVNI
jgi:AFG3 family protein